MSDINENGNVNVIPNFLTGKIRSGADLKFFYTINEQYTGGQQGLQEASFFDKFKKGLKKVFKNSEIIQFECPLSKQIKDSQAKQLWQMALSFGDIKIQVNEDSSSDCPRQFLLNLLFKIQPDYMRMVRDKVLQQRFKSSGDDKVLQDELQPQIQEELKNTQMRPQALKGRMAFKTQNVNGVQSKQRKKPWVEGYQEIWKQQNQKMQVQNGQQQNNI